MKRAVRKADPKSAKKSKKVPPKGRKSSSDDEEEEDEPEDYAVTIKKLQSEVDGLRGLFQESRALAEAQSIQLTAQQATMSELLNSQSPVGKGVVSKRLSTDPSTRIEELFISNWSASNSNLKVRIQFNFV